MTPEEAQQFIQEAKWKRAKSYDKTFPHEYTKREWHEDKERFQAFIEHIRTHGTIKRFYSKEYLYLEHQGWEYWEMGRPKQATIIINRAHIQDDKEYRQPTPPPSHEETLRNQLRARDKYVQTLLDKERTPREEEILQFHMQKQRKSPNRIDHSSQDWTQLTPPHKNT